VRAITVIGTNVVIDCETVEEAIAYMDTLAATPAPPEYAKVESSDQGPRNPSAEPYYLPMDCPVCGRVRMEWDGKVLSCEKCTTSSEWDGFTVDRYLHAAPAPLSAEEEAEQWLSKTTPELGNPAIVALNVRAFAVWLDLRRNSTLAAAPAPLCPKCNEDGPLMCADCGHEQQSATHAPLDDWWSTQDARYPVPAPLDVPIPMCVADCGCAGARIAETCDFIPGCSRCTPAPLYDPEYMCPNCVTPWKCNGPHIPEE
jgi:hypothetical protein